MENTERLNKFERDYARDEIKSLNYIFAKNEENNWFSREELSFARDYNLFDKADLETARQSWIDIKFE